MIRFTVMLYFRYPLSLRLVEDILFERGIELDDQDAMVRFVYGRALLARRDYKGALDELRLAVDMNPALAVGYCGIGDSLAYDGRFEEAFPYFQRALDLSPHDPQRWAFYAYRALAHLFAGQFEQALDRAQKSTRVPNSHYWPFSHRVSALGHLERQARNSNCRRRAAGVQAGIQPPSGSQAALLREESKTRSDLS